MEYLLFIAVDPEAEAHDPTDTSVDNIEDWVDEGKRRGINLRGDRLRPTEEAKVVRRRGGELLVSDGPFVESKEFIAGYDLLETADLDEAIEYASRHPMSKGGRVEIRPIWPFEEGRVPADRTRRGSKQEYFLLILEDPEAEPWDDTAAKAITEWAREADYSGAHILGSRLRPLDDSTLVRRRNRELLVTDGPFAEGREFILGFDILDCETEEEAIAFAERHPMSRFGRIEVRAAWPFDPEEES
jgi:hypothetical protein